MHLSNVPPLCSHSRQPVEGEYEVEQILAEHLAAPLEEAKLGRQTSVAREKSDEAANAQRRAEEAEQRAEPIATRNESRTKAVGA